MTTEIATASYFRQRQRNRLYEEVVKALSEAADSRGIKRRDIAAKLEKKPSQISRWLAGPSNWSIDTVSDLLYAINAELDFRVVSFKDRPFANEYHILSPEPSLRTPTPSAAAPSAALKHRVIDPE